MYCLFLVSDYSPLADVLEYRFGFKIFREILEKVSSRYLTPIPFPVPLHSCTYYTPEKRQAICMVQTVSKRRHIRVWTRDLTALTQHNECSLLCLRWRLRLPRLQATANQNERTCSLCPILWHILRPSHKPALVSVPDDTIIIFKLIIYSLKQSQSFWGCRQNININIKINHTINVL